MLGQDKNLEKHVILTITLANSITCEDNIGRDDIRLVNIAIHNILSTFSYLHGRGHLAREQSRRSH